jgi:hypothetical protein
MQLVSTDLAGSINAFGWCFLAGFLKDDSIFLYFIDLLEK